MRITKISFKNFRGATESHELGPCTLVTGPNGTGKSRILNAITFALSGSLNQLNKNIELFASYASGDEMSVTLEIDNGEYILERGIYKKVDIAKGGEETVSFKSNCSIESLGKKKKTLADVNAFVAEFLKFDKTVAEFTNFERMKDSERRDWFMSIVSSSEMSQQDILDWLGAKLSDNASDEYRKVYMDTLEVIASTLSKDIDVIIGKISEEYSQTNSAYRDAQGAENELAILRANLKGASTKKNALLADKEKARKQKDLADSEYAKLKAKADTFNPEKIVSLKNKISHAEALMLTKDDDLARLAKDMLLEYTDEEEKYGFDAVVSANEAREANAENIKTNAKEYKVSMKARQTLLDEIAEIERLKEAGIVVCPFTNMECSKVKRDLSKKFVESLNVLESKKQEAIDLNLEIERLVAEGNSYLLAEEKLSDALKKARDHHKLVVDSRRNNELVKSAIELTKAKALSYEASLPDMKLELEELLKAEKELPTQEELQHARNLCSAFSEEIGYIDLELADIIKKETLIETQQAMFSKAPLLKIKVKVLEDIKYFLGPNGLKGEIVTSNLHPIETYINQCLTAMGVDNNFKFTTVNDYGAEQLRLGWYTEGKYVPYESMSGSEKMHLAMCAVVAFLKLREAPMTVILIDEINQMDNHKELKTYEGVTALVADGIVDNVLLAGVTHQADTLGENFNIIRME